MKKNLMKKNSDKKISGHTTRQRFWVEISVALILVGLCIASRFVLVDYPNFKPVAALAMFLGVVFHHRWLALAAPMAVLLLSDLFFGFYELPIVIAVYSSMFIAGGVGLLMAKRFWETSSSLKRTGWIAAGSIVISLQFFLITNAATCLGGWYPVSFAGLLQSYVAGLPFLKYTMMGDLLFSVGLFSSFFAVLQLRSWQQSFAIARLVKVPVEP